MKQAVTKIVFCHILLLELVLKDRICSSSQLIQVLELDREWNPKPVLGYTI